MNAIDELNRRGEPTSYDRIATTARVGRGTIRTALLRLITNGMIEQFTTYARRQPNEYVVIR